MGKRFTNLQKGLEQGFHSRHFLPSRIEHSTVIPGTSRRRAAKKKILDKTGARLEKSPGARRAWSAMRLGDEVNDPGFESWQGEDIHLFFKTSRLDLGPNQPPTQRVPWFFPEGKSTEV